MLLRLVVLPQLGLGQEDLHWPVGLPIDQHPNTGPYDKRDDVGEYKGVHHFATIGRRRRALLLLQRHSGQTCARAAQRALARESPVLWWADGGSAGPVPHEVRHPRLGLPHPVDVDSLQLLREVVRQLRSGTIGRGLGRRTAGG